jgi:DNA-binding FadR family transcriptional regulator
MTHQSARRCCGIGPEERSRGRRQEERPADARRPDADEAARGVSRIPIRDALNLLAAEKIVRVRPNRGAQVICFSRKELAEVYSLRVILETDCLARAIPDIGDVDLERISQEMRRCEIEAGNEGFPEADWRFHRALYEPAGRPMQLAMIEELRTACLVHIAVYDRLRKGRSPAHPSGLSRQRYRDCSRRTRITSSDGSTITRCGVEGR